MACTTITMLTTGRTLARHNMRRKRVQFTGQTCFREYHSSPRRNYQLSTPPPPSPHNRHHQGRSPYENLSFWEKLRVLVPRAILTSGAAYLFREYCFDIWQCQGPSMYPTLHPNGEIVLVQKTVQGALEGGPQGAVRVRRAQQEQGRDAVWKVPRRSVSHTPAVTWWQAWKHACSPIAVGDVVAAQHPGGGPTLVCKRVLGLPGDVVVLTRRQASRFSTAAQQQLLVIPDGCVWLEGDHAAQSSDSRDYGPVPAEAIVGRVLVRLWPLRGQAWLTRGEPPVPSYGTTILPAGYQGQDVVTE